MVDALAQLMIARAAIASADPKHLNDAVLALTGGAHLESDLRTLVDSVQNLVADALSPTYAIDVTSLSELAKNLTLVADRTFPQPAIVYEQGMRFSEGEEGVLEFAQLAEIVTILLLTEDALRLAASS